MPYQQLSVLARAPQIGQVKTRLTGKLSDWEAYQFHRWSLQEVVGRLCIEVLGSAPLLFQTAVHEDFERLELSHPPIHQQGDHLGLKMLHALEVSFSLCDSPSPSDGVLLLGTDAPTLSPQWLRQGLDALSESQGPAIVIGPAEDGGYYTIGCNRAALPMISVLFDNDIEWGSDQVFNESLAIAHTLNAKVILLPLGFDIDRAEDLERARHSHTIDWNGLDLALTPSPLSPPQDDEVRASYQKALERLFSLTRFGERMDLSGPRAINQALGDPLASFKSVLIGGTNGKGSTSAALAHLALGSSLHFGVFTSPHLISFRERIRIGDRLISPEEVVLGVETVFAAAEQAQITLSFFEATWAIAIWFFKQQGVEWAIWEVGLGGRLDATNVCDPLCSAISSLSLDHMHILGDSLDQIAIEKAAIYREGRPALTGCNGESLRILSLVSPVKPRPITNERDELESAYRSYIGGDKSQERSPSSMIHSAHGRSNIALAWEIARSLNWPITGKTSLTDLSVWTHLTWGGRFEKLEGLWLDCAHNRDGADQVLSWLKAHRVREPKQALHLIVGMSADKEIKEVLKRFALGCDRLTFVSPIYPRCASANELSSIYERTVCPLLLAEGAPLPEVKMVSDVSTALRNRDDTAITLVTGSCFLVGEARAWLLGVPFPELGVVTTAR